MNPNESTTRLLDDLARERKRRRAEDDANRARITVPGTAVLIAAFGGYRTRGVVEWTHCNRDGEVVEIGVRASRPCVAGIGRKSNTKHTYTLRQSGRFCVKGEKDLPPFALKVAR